MDIFFEQLVIKKKTALDFLKKLGIILLALILFYILVIFIPQFFAGFGYFGVMLGVAGLFGAYYLISYMYTEYEYIITNGELDIDKIMGRKKRKRIITVNTRDFTEFGMYDKAEHTNRSYDLVLNVCHNIKSEENYYAVCEHQTFGKCLIIMSLNENMVDVCKKTVKRTALKL